jgi:hypothetical protein
MEVNMKEPTLVDEILMIDPNQAKRFAGLSREVKQTASHGIIRHLRACRKLGCSPDGGAIREIIDDALHGRMVFAEQTDVPPPAETIAISPKGRRYR